MQPLDVSRIVLAIGIDDDDVAVTLRRGRLETGHLRRSLTAIGRELEQLGPGMRFQQLLELREGGRVTAIVDHQHR